MLLQRFDEIGTPGTEAVVLCFDLEGFSKFFRLPDVHLYAPEYLQEKAEKATEELAYIRAWRAFFEPPDDAMFQSLKAWTKAVDRIGKGRGKYAYRHRRAARQYLMDCVPKIPAWVMPLHKLWDTVDAQPGMFDTVIVDEASQAGIDSLALLLLAKRIVVVGDDKQNSPEAIGVLEDDIARLAREHLSQFRFHDEFRPDTSLFDHAERAFGSLISLREHFRCVPEIIRFSNDLCYRDTPLIPLRQAPPNRPPPIISRYISEGACEGEGQRIRNRAEAEALVEGIQSLVEDDAYESKTIGVIALQGHGQAELIEKLLAQRLDAKTIQERRLRCGEPATFQGDQRDIIFLSLVIAPNIHYRALSRLPDQRRFNVAMSRARDQVRLFHSVRQHDLSPEDLRRKLLSFFESPGQGASDRVYVEGCPGLQRVGKVVRQALSRALGPMLRAGEIAQQDELGDGSQEGSVVRLAGAGKVRVRPAGSRDLLDIPPSELLAVLQRLFPANPGAGEDDEALLRSVLEHYGFSRLTRPRRDYLVKVIRLRDTKEEDFGATNGIGSEAV